MTRFQLKSAFHDLSHVNKLALTVMLLGAILFIFQRAHPSVMDHIFTIASTICTFFCALNIAEVRDQQAVQQILQKDGLMKYRRTDPINTIRENRIVRSRYIRRCSRTKRFRGSKVK